MSILLEVELQTALKDVDSGVSAVSDVPTLFNSSRSTGTPISGSEVSDFIDSGIDLNDEVDCVGFAIEQSDGSIIKVYVAEKDAEAFNDALSHSLGVDLDPELALSELANQYDIIDVVFPRDPIIAPTAVTPGTGAFTTGQVNPEDFTHADSVVSANIEFEVPAESTDALGQLPSDAPVDDATVEPVNPDSVNPEVSPDAMPPEPGEGDAQPNENAENAEVDETEPEEDIEEHSEKIGKTAKAAADKVKPKAKSLMADIDAAA